MRITMIIREMVRSFRRSLWVNLLMTVQMSICFFSRDHDDDVLFRCREFAGV